MAGNPFDYSGSSSSSGGGSNINKAAALLPGILKSIKRGKGAPQRRAQFQSLVAGAHSDAISKLEKRTGTTDADIVNVMRGNNVPTPDTSSGFLDRAFNDLTNTIASVPRGIVGTAAAVGKETAHGLVEAFAHPTGSPHASPGRAISNLSHLATGNPTPEQLKNEPFTAAMGQSLARTANRITHPVEAYHEYSQHPFSTLAEDVGNASLVLAPAAKVLEPLSAEAAASDIGPVAAAGRAGGRVASALELGKNAANKVAQGPFLPYTAPARVANKLLAPIADTAERVAPDVLKPLTLDKAGRAARAEIRAGAKAQEAVPIRQMRLGKQIEHVLPHPDEQVAYTLVGQGEADALAKLRQAAPDKFDAFVSEHFKDDPQVTPAVANLAADVVEGKNPELASRIDQALAVHHAAPGGGAERETLLLEGPASRQNQLGYEPDPIAIRKELAPIQAKLDKATSGAEKARLRADLATLKAQSTRTNKTVGEFGPNLSNQAGSRVNRGLTTADLRASEGAANLEGRAQVLGNLANSAETRQARLSADLRNTEANARYDVGNAPARLRPALSINRAVQSTLTEHENALRRVDPSAAHDVGIIADEIPTTLEHMRANGVDPEHFIHVQFTDKLPPGNAPAARLQFPGVRKTSQARYRGASTAFDRTVKAQAQGEIKLFKQQIQNETADTIANLPIAGHLGSGALEGATTKEEAAALGYSAWDPRTPFETPNTVDENTTFLPTHVKTAFRRYFAQPNRFEKAIGMTFDPITRVYKASVLALSPAWHIGKFVSDFFLSGIGGGVNPLELANGIQKALRQYRESGPKGLRQFAAPDELMAHGPGAEANDYVYGSHRTKVGSTIGAPAQVGYKAFQTMDNVMRSAFYIAKKSQGYTDEEAVRIGLRALGDFQNLSPFERRVVRRVIPFYAWQKHITKLAFSLPIEHPIRTAWTLKLATEFGQPDSWENSLPSFLRTAVNIGSGASLIPGRMFPFPVNPLETLTQPGASLNPIIKLGAENAPFSPVRGVNLNTGAPFSRPAGTGRLDEFGRPLPTAPSLLEQLRGLTPQSKLLDSLTGRKDVARYDTGQPVTFKTPDGKKHTIPTPQDPGQAILKALGIPIEANSDLQGMALSAELKKAAAAKARGELPSTKKKAKAKSGNPFDYGG